jgi:hypothetical protein
MMLITRAKVVPGLEGWLLLDFNNGERRFVDIKPAMKGILEKLKDPEFFKKVTVDQELGTITWPGDLDFDPDYLYAQGIRVKEVESLAKLLDKGTRGQGPRPTI